MTPRIPATQLALAGLVILIWGSNFIVVKWGLDRMEPLALCAWRFLFSFVPACLILRPPLGHMRLVMAFGILTGLGQFGLLFIAMEHFISPAMASVVVQAQAFFNVALAGVVLKEGIRPSQIVGCLIAAAGLVVIGIYGGASATLVGVLLTLSAGMAWAVSNVIVRKCDYRGDLLTFMVWTSLYATIPLSLLSLMLEGPVALLAPITHFDWSLAALIAWQAYANTVFSYAVWNALVRRYSLSRIAPLTLLIPVITIGLAVVLLDEQLAGWKIVSAALIITGIGLPYVLQSRATAAKETPA